jgi:hypothetical protein
MAAVTSRANALLVDFSKLHRAADCSQRVGIETIN